MAQTLELKATARERSGKGAARKSRRQGLIPAVIYGDGKAPEVIDVPSAELVKYYGKGHFLTTLVNLDVSGRKTQVIPRDVQVDPVRDFVIHVDFLRVSANSTIRVGIPVAFRNHDKSPGLKRGGVLNVVRHEVELYCRADGIPETIEVDLEGLDIGASVHISHIKLPPNTRPVIQDRDFTVATIAGAQAEEVEAAPGAVEGALAEGAEAGAEGAAAAAPADAKEAKGKDEKGGGKDEKKK